jgi:acyl carrier protein
MTKDEIKSKITQIFRDVLDDTTIELHRETTADDIEGWDSLAHISIIVAAEKEFKIKFDLYELKRLHTVGELLDLVEMKMS